MVSIHPLALAALRAWRDMATGVATAPAAYVEAYNAWSAVKFQVDIDIDIDGDDHVRLVALEAFIGTAVLPRLGAAESRLKAGDQYDADKTDRDEERFEAIGADMLNHEHRLNRAASGLAELTVALNELREANGLAPVSPYVEAPITPDEEPVSEPYAPPPMPELVPGLRVHISSSDPGHIVERVDRNPEDGSVSVITTKGGGWLRHAEIVSVYTASGSHLWGIYTDDDIPF
jgi:hypothetical protein